MKKLLIVIALVNFGMHAAAQLSYNWGSTYRMNTYSTEFFTSVAPDNAGGTFVSSHFSDSVAPNPALPNAFVAGTIGGQNNLVSRIDASGNLVFAHLFHTNANSFTIKDIQTDDAGNVIVVGHARYTFGGTPVDLDPSPAGTFEIASNVLFIAKYDANGNFITAKRFNMETFNFDVYEISYRNNSVLINGFFKYGAHFSQTPGQDTLYGNNQFHSFAAMYNANSLDLVWYDAFRNDRPVDYSVFHRSAQVIKPNGNVVMAYAIGGTVNLSNGSSYTASGDYDIVLLEYNTSGALVNDFIFSSSAVSDYPRDLSVDASGNLLFCGYAHGTINLDVNGGTNLTGSAQNFIVKYDPAFNILWKKSAGTGNTQINDLEFDSNGDFFLSGRLFGSFDFDFTPGFPETYQLTSTGGNWYDEYIVKYTAAGNPVMALHLGNASNYAEHFRMRLNDSDDIFLAGMFGGGPTDMNFGSAVDEIDANTFQYMYTAKYTACTPQTYTVNASFCQGDDYLLPSGTTVNSAGTYSSTFQNVNSCDSIIETILTMHPSYNVAQAAGICPGETFLLPDGSAVSSQGSYSTTLISTTGCDSVVVTALEIYPNYSTNETATICAGESYDLPDGTTANQAGTYTSFLFTENGCDSTVTTTLTINSANAGVVQTGNTLQAVSSTGSFQWINCADNLPIPGATENTFSPEGSGSYALVITDNGCEETSSCYEIAYATTNDLATDGIMLFPNPSSGTITIRIPDSLSEEQLTISNLNGQEIWSTLVTADQLQLDLASGVYIVRIGVHASRVIIR